MNSQITGLRVAALLFGILAILQLGRLIMQPEIVVAGTAMPLWPSVLAVIVLGAMCYWMWWLTHMRTH